MKETLTAKEIVDYLDKKSSEIEGTIMIKELYPIDCYGCNKHEAFHLGIDIGKLQGQRDILIDLIKLLNK